MDWNDLSAGIVALLVIGFLSWRMYDAFQASDCNDCGPSCQRSSAPSINKSLAFIFVVYSVIFMIIMTALEIAHHFKKH